MKIGVVKEIKDNENRVSVVPDGVALLVKNGHTVYVQKNAGEGSGFSTAEYKKAGAIIIDTMDAVYQEADLIVKVKEPQPIEYDMLKKGQNLFTYLHLAVEPELAEILTKKKINSIAYESVQKETGELPLLTPMSEIAGKMSVQIGAHFLESHNGGAGVLLGGVPGVRSGNVLIVGAGTVGINALRTAIGTGAHVSIADVDINKLRKIDDLFGSRVQTVVSNPANLETECKKADLVVGAVLIPNSKAPRIITEDMVKSMKKGSVIVDVAIDQGGIVETINNVTTHANPVVEKHGVIHYSVANIPGAVAHTSTLALTNATLPYLLSIANNGFIGAIKKDSALERGVNTFNGEIVKAEVASALNMKHVELAMMVGF
ncbi:alanine dehydrogenase [bacterium]|nr:alanine dehydrogenase [bacterium]